MRKTEWGIVALALLALVVSAILSPYLPSKLVTHWNAAGEPDGYMEKTAALLLMPLVISGLAILLLLIPRLDPLKENVADFRGYYDGFVLIFSGVMLIVHLLILSWGLGWQVNPLRVILPAVGLVLYDAGLMMGHSRRNWFVGVRTPWTLSSDAVWRRTHDLAALLFKLSGVLAAASAFVPQWGVWLLLIPTLSSSIAVTVYSYVLYRRE